MKLKRNQIHKVRSEMQEAQGNTCAICGGSFSAGTWSSKKKKVIPKYKPCLDHHHGKGYVRSVLCHRCNAVEGKITSAIKRYQGLVPEHEVPHYLREVARYLENHYSNQTGLIHPDHKTEEEKREKRNAAARARRKRAALANATNTTNTICGAANT